MTPQDVMRKYLGWCPRFEPRINSLPTYTNLSMSGRVAFTAILLLTGFMSIMWTLIGVSNWIKNLYLGFLGYPFVNFLLELISGIILTVLTIDFVATRTVLRRHKLELLGYVATSVVQTAYWLSFNVLAYLSGNPAAFPGVQELRYLGFIVLGLYVGYKLLANKKVLVKNTFLFLSVFFTGCLLNEVESTLRSWNITTSSLPLDVFRVDIILIDVVFGAAAIFFLKTYLELRRRPMFEVATPVYVRGIFLIYGASMLIQGIYEVFLSNPPTNMDFYGGMVGYTALVILNFALPLAFVLASIHSPRFSVGEPGPRIDSMEARP
jgi:hypothetical protein